MPRRQRFSVSLAIIVRDEETRLKACLRSTAGLFDDVVVVDTGSRDRTLELARSLGARVFEFPWCDDFSAARNVAQSHCTSDYVFWMDADETLPCTSRTKMARLLRGMTDDSSVYAINQTSLRTQRLMGYSVVPMARLIPTRARLQWARRVHERIIAPSGRSIPPVTLAPIEVLHHGFTDPSEVARKLERNKRLVEIELEEDAADRVALYNLAATHFLTGGLFSSLDHYRLAQSCLERLIQGTEGCGSALGQPPSASADSYILLAWTLLAQLGFTDAMTACIRGRAIHPGDLGLLCAEAAVLAHSGWWKEARARWNLMPWLRAYRDAPGMTLGKYAKLVAAKIEYAYSLEENGEYYEALAVWIELAQNSAGLFDALPGLKRTLRLILRDGVRRPGFFLRNLNRIAETLGVANRRKREPVPV